MHTENCTNPVKNKSKVCYHGQSQLIKVRKKWGGWDRELLQFSLMDNVMKKWNGWICAVSSYNRVQGADRGQASASGEAAERAQIELDHKGPNMHWGPRYCLHSCPIQWALKGKSYFKTEFTCYSCYSIGYSCESASLIQICHHETKVQRTQCITLPWWMGWQCIDTAHIAKTEHSSASLVLTTMFLCSFLIQHYQIWQYLEVTPRAWRQCQLNKQKLCLHSVLLTKHIAWGLTNVMSAPSLAYKLKANVFSAQSLRICSRFWLHHIKIPVLEPRCSFS